MQIVRKMRSVDKARGHLGHQQSNFINRPVPQNRKEMVERAHHNLVNLVNQHQPRPARIHHHKQIHPNHQLVNPHVDTTPNVRRLLLEL